MSAVSVDDVRTLQVMKDRGALDRLPVGALHVDVEGMVRGRRARLEERMAGLEAGAEVLVQGWELADELKAVAAQRWGLGGRCFRIVGDDLVVDFYRDYRHG